MNKQFEENEYNNISLDKEKILPNYDEYINNHNLPETKKNTKYKKYIKYVFIYFFIVILLAIISFLTNPDSFLKPITDIKGNIQERDIFVYTSGIVNLNQKYLKKSAPMAIDIENVYRHELSEMFKQKFGQEKGRLISEAYIKARKNIKIEVKSNSETNVDVNIYMFTKKDFDKAISNALNSTNFEQTLDKEIENLKYEDKHTINTEIVFQDLRKMWKPLFIKKYCDDVDKIVLTNVIDYTISSE